MCDFVHRIIEEEKRNTALMNAKRKAEGEIRNRWEFDPRWEAGGPEFKPVIGEEKEDNGEGDGYGDGDDDDDEGEIEEDGSGDGDGDGEELEEGNSDGDGDGDGDGDDALVEKAGLNW